MRNKLVIAAGGTGGHLYPAISLVQELKKRGSEILLVVHLNEMAKKILEQEGIPYCGITASPFFGQSFTRRLKGLFQNGSALFQSLKILNQFQATSVVGFGAYATAPVILAAALKRIPIVVHEQNLAPGWANRFGALFARKVAVSFPETMNYFNPNKTILTGNLIREDLVQRSRLKSNSSDRLRILVFGGSAGAKSINRAVIQSLPQILDMKDSLQFLHISGSKEETLFLKKSYDAVQVQATIHDYVYRMTDCYSQADIAVCRSGATTVAELVATQTPAILIPYPHATANHQTKNAQFLKNLGAAFLIPESDDLPNQIGKTIQELVQSEETLKRMRQSYEKCPMSPGLAAQKLADLILNP
ncbi:MAG: undecaprenyldiphospho-muramoylpentapeptide beta-N-acetylglucosaminyltransferase [Elusimicrobia bacterium]|nr:undecaprenyldiphospho-muramoylpentapeptide beta-N-acetylglucosaminyltransferase [Elusimicrobiota bacterium]MBI3012800.1 undecaprenyldiphospho-muramoylpentapeptide beta-N-acetylglucosaminyltransferase [Elusimicrobiota bacterium]